MKSVGSYMLKVCLLSAVGMVSSVGAAEDSVAPAKFVNAIESDVLLVQHKGLAIYHPTLGFVNYETILCGAKDETEQAFHQLVVSVCNEQQGKMYRNWCIDKQKNTPLFHAELDGGVSRCQEGEYASIVHVLEALPSIKISAKQRNNWLQVARSFGYQ